jgi:acyl-CoA synthetase (AMP-forming)/AMP-acid ligase II
VVSTMMTAGREIRQALNRAADAVLVLSADGSVVRTGAELLERAECLAGALVDLGLEHGVVGLSYRNSAAALEAFIATELIGATRLPVEPSAAPAEARAIYEAGGARVVVTDDDHNDVPATDPRVPRSSPLSDATLVHTVDRPLEGPRRRADTWVEASTPLVVYPRAVRGGELFGIPTSYANWRSIIRINRELYESGGYGPTIGQDERYLTVVQLMHATGMVGSFPFLHLGLPQVMLPRFNAAAAIEAIRRHQVTTAFVVPGMLTRIADHLERAGAADSAERSLPSLRRVLYGGAPVEPDDLRRLIGVFGPALCQLYGRYEAGWPLTVLSGLDHGGVLRGDTEIVGSCGRPIDQVEIELHPVPGTASSCEIRTRNAMVSPSFADPDGWCSLGDTAVRTPRGYLHLTGRLDGMINTGSFHVYPDEVRDALLALSGVSDALVVGVPDPVWGEAVTAYVVTDEPVTADALRGQLKRRLATYKVPTAVHVVDDLVEATNRRSR